MRIGNILARATRIATAAVALSVAAPTLAESSSNPSSPIGTWEMVVSGRVEGESIKGLAVISFTVGEGNEAGTAGNLTGYYLVRGSPMVENIEGVWEQSGRGFTGTVEISGIGELEISGRARSERTASARVSDDSGNRVSLKGKYVGGTLPDASGTYVGTVREGGETYEVSLNFNATEGQNGQYELSGSVQTGDELFEIDGEAIVSRTGAMVAYVTSEGYGLYLYGKVRPGTSLTASGSTGEGNRIRVRLNAESN